MLVEQKFDSTLQDVRNDNSLKFQEFPASFNKTLLCGVTLGTPISYIPSTQRRVVFDTLHGLSHPSKPSKPSKRTTYKLISDRFV